MTKSKNKKLYIILFTCLFSICAVFMPFIFSKNKNKVFADSISSTSYLSDSINVVSLPVRVLSGNEPSSFYYNNQIMPFYYNVHFYGTDTFSFRFINARSIYRTGNTTSWLVLNTFPLLGTTESPVNSISLSTFGHNVNGHDATVQKYFRLSDTSSTSTYYGYECCVWLERYNDSSYAGTSFTLLDYFAFDYLYSVSFKFSNSGYGYVSNGIYCYSVIYTCRVPYIVTDSNGVNSTYYKYMDFVTSWYVPASSVDWGAYYGSYQNATYYFATSYLTEQEIAQGYYDSGYSAGKSSGISEGYSQGAQEGYSDGYTAGDSAGYTRGLQDANQYSFMGLIGATIDAPIKALTGLLNFEILGINLSAFVYGLFSITLVIIVIKYIKGSK